MRKIKHGFLGKVIYEKEEFKEVPPSTEERRKAVLEKMKPWKFNPDKLLYAAGKGFAPTPPAETFYLQTAQGDNLQTAQGDNILWYIEPAPSPTPTPSATITPTPTLTPTMTPTPSATPSVWAPSQMSNLNDWWRADTGVSLTGSDVDSWEGYNGTLFNAVDVSLKATYSASSSNWNSQAAITINPTNSASNAAYTAYTSGGTISRTIYGVFRINSVVNERGLFTMEDGRVGGSATSRASFLTRTTETPNKLYSYQSQLVNNSADYITTNINDGVGSYIFCAIEYDAVSATKTSKFYASNSSTLGSVINTSSGTLSAVDAGYINLGMYAAFLPLPAESLDVVEVISVNGLLNPTDLSNLETYLSSRYGI